MKIIDNHKKLSKIFGQAHVNERHGHHASYMELQAIQNCE